MPGRFYRVVDTKRVEWFGRWRSGKSFVGRWNWRKLWEAREFSEIALLARIRARVTGSASLIPRARFERRPFIWEALNSFKHQLPRSKRSRNVFLFYNFFFFFHSPLEVPLEFSTSLPKAERRRISGKNLFRRVESCDQRGNFHEAFRPDTQSGAT